MTSIPSKHIFEQIVFDQSKNPLIENNLRGVFAEYLIVDILGANWSVCEGSWNGWDIDGPNDTRVEVKSSAYIQSWYDWSVEKGKTGVSVPRFDIAERNNVKLEKHRAADLYIFALHAEKKPELADHRIVEQWNFCVVKSAVLPKGQKSIGVSGVQKLSNFIEAKNLQNEVSSNLEKWAR